MNERTNKQQTERTTEPTTDHGRRRRRGQIATNDAGWVPPINCNGELSTAFNNRQTARAPPQPHHSAS